MENMIRRVEEEIRNYIGIKSDRNDIYVDFLVGVEREDIVVVFANCEELPSTVFKGIWRKKDNTITITEYVVVREEFIYVD